MSNTNKLMEAAMIIAAQELERACQRALFERSFKETQDYIESVEARMKEEKKLLKLEERLLKKSWKLE